MIVVACRFFQQGNCRFGQNCNYEHSNNPKYTYHAPAKNTVNDEQLINIVQSDVEAALNGGQWILSCYAPLKDKSCFPGIQDISQEEARLMMYEAKNNNKWSEAANYMNNIFKEARYKYEQLYKPNAQIIQVLKKMYHGETVTSPFNSGTHEFRNNTSYMFQSISNNNIVQNTGFGHNNSVLGGADQQNSSGSTNAKSLFGQACQKEFGPSQPSNIFHTANQQNTSAKSVFAQASQNVFGPTQQSPMNIFAINNQETAQSNSSNVFNQNNPFKQSDPFRNSDPFNQAKTDVFGVTNTMQNTENNNNIYSKIEELSESDLEAFQSEEFQLGFVPELPPLHRLCI
ncbi:nucleoporin NUP42-like isoform X2 [Leptidea sinapis]|uniref:nucleoporin NUP42-like isoform X2 n=1 Tax=Leptidea sinapis TaxID=189913 RepID=UPI002121853C|nr:nucleoporin NUP42-like isoform X2 [Leptidea sinapis]